MNGTSGATKAGILIGLVVAGAIAAAAVAVWKADFTGRKGSRLGKDFEYDLAPYQKTDPGLILFSELKGRSIATGFRRALGLAVGAGGQIHVVGDRAVSTFSPEGKELSRLATEAEPRCLAVDGSGALYVAFKDHVATYDDAGRKLATWQPAGPKAVLTSIAVAGENVFVADAGHRVVRRYDKAGRLIGLIGDKDKQRGIDGFVVPSPHFDLAVGSDGNLRVVNPGRHRIETYTVQGDPRGYWGGRRGVRIEDFCGCCNPVNFAILPDGKFVTAEKGLPRVKLYGPDGAFLGVVAGVESFAKGSLPHPCQDPQQCGRGALDLAVDRDGRVLVLDTRTAEVRTFVPKKVQSSGQEHHGASE